jgi:hypothetical protein
VILGVAQVTYKEHVSTRPRQGEKCAQISSGSTWGLWPDTESIIDTLLPTPEDDEVWLAVHEAPLTFQNSHHPRQIDLPFDTCFLADAKDGHSQTGCLTA